jgi:ABC-type branched-subunit amino acid transport system substrate-binding protein
VRKTMLSVLRLARKSLGRIAVGVTAVILAACTPGTTTTGGPSIDTSAPVPVALLVPSGSGQAGDEALAQSLQNAAKLAISDLSGVQIDLRVYSTGGQPGQAQAMALRAVDEGALIILGPVFAQEANAAGVAVAGRGINVLSFSNNPDIAGGNVFVLGQTFESTAARLASYAARNGKRNLMVVHDRNTGGELGLAAIRAGASAAGASIVSVGNYEFSQNGIVAAVPGIAASAKASGADAIFFTADTAGALPLVTQLLRENGVATDTTRFIGLTRWDVPNASLGLPGLQGGWFALPDPGLYQQYQARYQAAFGSAPHPISGLAYDGIAAIGALVKQGKANALTGAALTQGSGFAGVNGIFRLRKDGTNDRGLAVAEVRGGQLVVVDAAPRSFGGAGF